MVDPVSGLGRLPTLRGRADECAQLERLLAGVRGGEGRTLVLHGEAGIGKTALLEYAAASASDLRVLRVVGVESEKELAYAGLHQLCEPLQDGIGSLPHPQREALDVVFGLSSGDAPDRFLVGLGVLTLLSEVSEDGPLLCVVDDAQWLDRSSAQTLAFVARRLLAEPVAMLFAAREPGEDLRGLPELEVEGLHPADARELLATTVRWSLDEAVREQIVAETRGNPLAVLELPRRTSTTELAGGFGVPRALSLSARIEESFLTRVRDLPTDTQRLLLVAAAEPVGDPVLLWGAAQKLGLTGTALGPAERAGLLEPRDTGRLRFRHPLLRSAVYRVASAEERHEVHRALAEATDATTDGDRRAWHRAEATAGLDDEVGDELEQAAARAQARGGLAAAAAFLARSFDLTSDPELRTDRALAAAEASIGAGGSDAARRLLAAIESRPLTELQRGRAELLRGRIAAGARWSRDAALLLLKAATRLGAVDRGLAVRTYSEAFYFAATAGRGAVDGGTVQDVARGVRGLPRPSRLEPTEALLTGLAHLIIDGYAVGAPVIQWALREVRGQEMTPADEFLWLPLACRLAEDTWDVETWTALASRLVNEARQTGALIPLRDGLLQTVLPQLFAGQLPAAAAAAEEVQAITAATGSRISPTAPLVIAAWQGRADQVERVIATESDDASARGNGIWFSIAGWASAVLYNGLGRYEEAVAAAEDGSRYPPEMGRANRSMVELVEAAARVGAPERAAGAMDRIAETANICRTDWVRGIDARSRALLAEGETADRLYRTAIEYLGRTGLQAWLARTQLVYGEWLRREGRRVEARAHLRAAHQVFAASGMIAFAERAEREAVATGEHLRARSPETRDELTAQELQIAELALDGLSNPEIGSRLFLSPRTVEWHLRHVFAKLDIRSRRELHKVLPASRARVITD